MLVNPSLYGEFQNKLSSVILDIWKPSGFFSAIEAAETLYILTYGLQIELEDFLNKDENLELKDAWEELSGLLKKLTEEYNQPQRYNNFEEECNGPLGRLRNIIFPEVVSKTEEPLRLFLVNDRIWVVARSKKRSNGRS